MVRKSIEERVLTLEQQMSELRELPAHVAKLGSEFSQLRAEMRDEFSAIRGEMAAGFGAVREDMARFRADMIARDEETRRAHAARGCHRTHGVDPGGQAAVAANAKAALIGFSSVPARRRGGGRRQSR